MTTTRVILGINKAPSANVCRDIRENSIGLAKALKRTISKDKYGD